jgi:hypothetical protein
MEYIEMNQADFDNIQGYNDLDEIAQTNNLFGLGKNAAKKAVARKTKRLKKAEKKGNKKKVARLKKNIVKVQTKGTGIQRAGKTVGKIVRNIAGVTVLAPLQPFRKKMVDAINKNGGFANSKTDLPTVAKRFYDTVVKKHEKHLDEYDFTTMPEDHLVAVLPIVIEAIISFFKKSKEKVDAGESVSAVEAEAAKATEEVTEVLQEKAKEEAAETVGNKILFDKKTQFIIIGVVILIVGIAIYFAREK